MILLIVLSLIPLMFKEKPAFFTTVEMVCLVCFIGDYLLRWIAADYRFGRHHWTSFVRYPFRPISIVDLLSIVALPAGIVTAEYMHSLQKKD